MRSVLKPALTFRVRWMMPGDAAAVTLLELDEYGEEFAYSTLELGQLIKRGDARVIVAETDAGEIAGHVIYSARSGYWKVWEVLVGPKFRRRGVGRALLEHVAAQTAKWHGPRRSRVEFVSPESRTDQHLFLRACGFRAVSIGQDEDGEDEYRFIWRDDYLEQRR